MQVMPVCRVRGVGTQREVRQGKVQCLQTEGKSSGKMCGNGIPAWYEDGML